MKQTKHPLSKEAAFALGILFMAFGVACVSISRFGYSMIVAPVYLIFRKLGGALSFGTVEYLYQGALLILLCIIIRRFRWQYLLSFLTAVIYGFTFDFALLVMQYIPADALFVRILLFAAGTILISVSIAFFMRTYLPPEVYELFVRELANTHHLPFGRVKLCFDCVLCVFSIALSVLLFGGGVFESFSVGAFLDAVVSGYVLEGIGIGTVIAALVNGPLITAFGKLLDRHFVLTQKDRLAAVFKT